MPEIDEDRAADARFEDNFVSGSTSTAQTPTTPRIDVENASSSSHAGSGDSSPERELFGMNFTNIRSAFLEGAADVDLRSSAEELSIPYSDARRATSPALLSLVTNRSKPRKISWDAGDDPRSTPSIERKASAGIIRNTDPFFFNYRSTRLGSLTSNASSSQFRRSPSPHRMLLETSFCGSKNLLDRDAEDEYESQSDTRRSSMSSCAIPIRDTSRTTSPMPTSPGHSLGFMLK